VIELICAGMAWVSALAAFFLVEPVLKPDLKNQKIEQA
jgi:hypothetical protein